MTSKHRQEGFPSGEPSRDVIAMRDAIVMIAAMVDKMDKAAIEAHARIVGMPVDLVPLVQAFNDRRVQTTEIIAAWMENDGKLGEC
jgi:hypothetical protein